MRKISVLMSSCAVALFATVAVAQPPDAPAGERAVPPPGADAAGDREKGDAFYRASEVLGTTVRSSDGQSLGQVQDLLIDRRSQQIRYFILGEGDAAQAQSNLTVVPWMAARPMFQGDQRFVDVRIEQQRLREAPTFTWQEIQTGPPQWTTRVNQFYGVREQGRRGVRGEIERDGDIEIDGRRPRGDRPRGDRPRRGDVERERNGNVEIEGREREGRRDEPGVNVRPNGEVEVEGGTLEKATEGDVEVEGRTSPRRSETEVEVDE